MMNKIEMTTILSNFLSLTILKALNYILPLITFPYLVRVLGVDKFGLLSMAIAVVAYFVIIVNYGFELSATKKISLNRDNLNKLSEIYSSVLSIRLLLLVFSFLVYIIIIFSFEVFREYYVVYLFTFGTVVGQALFPVWFFQGIEQMKYITILNIISKSIFTLAIFVFIQEESHYYLVPIFTSLGFIFVGITSLYIVNKKFNIKFKFQNIVTLKYYFLDGWHIFLSRFYLNLYTTTNTVLLGLFTNNTTVGYYAIAEKIVQVIGGLLQPANQALFPFLTKKYKENKKYFDKLIKKISLYYFFISVILTSLLYIFKEILITLITGSFNNNIETILSILLLGIFAHPFGSLFTNILVIKNQNKNLLKVMNYTVLINFSLVPLSIYLYSEIGLAYSSIIVITMHIVFLKYFLLNTRG